MTLNKDDCNSHYVEWCVCSEMKECVCGRSWVHSKLSRTSSLRRASLIILGITVCSNEKSLQKVAYTSLVAPGHYFSICNRAVLERSPQSRTGVAGRPARFQWEWKVAVGLALLNTRFTEIFRCIRAKPRSDRGLVCLRPGETGALQSK